MKYYLIIFIVKLTTLLMSHDFFTKRLSNINSKNFKIGPNMLRYFFGTFVGFIFLKITK